MKERPILFSTPMVQAILEGRKTQTRRVVKFAHVIDDIRPVVRCDQNEKDWGAFLIDDEFGETHLKRCPFGKVGDRLWVRETFAEVGSIGKPIDWFEYQYKADFRDGIWQGDFSMCFDKWKPSLFMPRAACRITLEIESVRVERLQDISREDAISEGVYYSDAFDGFCTDDGGRNFHASDPRISFCKLWLNIHSPELWDANPFVWVITFKKL